MRAEAQPAGSSLTVGELRALMLPLSDEVPVFVGGLPVDGAVAEDLRVDLLVDMPDGTW